MSASALNAGALQRAKLFTALLPNRAVNEAVSGAMPSQIDVRAVSGNLPAQIIAGQADAEVARIVVPFAFRLTDVRYNLTVSGTSGTITGLKAQIAAADVTAAVDPAAGAGVKTGTLIPNNPLAEYADGTAVTIIATTAADTTIDLAAISLSVVPLHAGARELVTIVVPFRFRLTDVRYNLTVSGTSGTITALKAQIGAADVTAAVDPAAGAGVKTGTLIPNNPLAEYAAGTAVTVVATTAADSNIDQASISLAVIPVYQGAGLELGRVVIPFRFQLARVDYDLLVSGSSGTVMAVKALVGATVVTELVNPAAGAGQKTGSLQVTAPLNDYAAGSVVSVVATVAANSNIDRAAITLTVVPVSPV